MNHEDRIFNAAVKLFAHKDITLDRAVTDAIRMWSKVLELVEDDEMYDADESVDEVPDNLKNPNSLDAVVALRDIQSAAAAGVNGRNITEGTRCAECAIIATAALARYDALADESVDDLPTSELLARGYMNVAELDKRQLPLDF